ncbi:MAG: hypothetical protein PSV17_04110 [Methylotenera sp.]|uniref:hypothetical protein n=1 Tax=Methylotenera sp. TaxID=2051956 RepID=UPI00248A4BC3|nr:hypothetical protein [Methylotenera sp.]MDI1308603.1 hypothetical protein [Methylotenera sp.]
MKINQNSEPNITKNSKQNSIYLSLQTVLSEEEANEVIEKWSTYFQDTGSVFNGLNSFAKEVCQTYGIADQQRDLLRALHRALLLGDSDSAAKVVKDNTGNNLSIDPAIESINEIDNNQYQALFTSQVISTPEFLTFQCLLLKILDLLGKFENGFNQKLNPFLIELTQSMPWSVGQQNQLLSLINTGKTVQLRTYKPDQLKSFLKHLRAWLEGEIGGTIATQVMDEAIEAMNNEPENLNYNVKKFQ